MIISKETKKVLIGVFAFVISLSSTSCDDSVMDRKDRVAAIVGELEDPFVSVTFSPQVLMDKSGVKNGALPFTYEAFATFFLSEEKTGIDNDGQMQVIVENSGGMVPNAYVFVPLNNADVFKTLVEKELGAKVQEKNGAYYFRKDDDNYVVAWKGDIAIISNIPFSFNNLFSKGTNVSKKAAIHLVTLLNEVSKSNINKEFRQFFDKEGDVLLYANGQTAYRFIDGMQFMSKKDKAQLESVLDGTILELALNFEEGQISFKGNYALADSLKSYFNVLKSSGISADMLEYGMSSDPMMAVSLNMSPAHFVSILNSQRKVMDTKGLEDVLKGVGLKLSDLEDLFSGEILFLADGLDSVEINYTNYNGEEITHISYEPNFATVIGLKDAKGVQVAINKMQGDVQVQKIDGLWYYIIDDKLFLTSTENWLNKIKAGETVQISTDENIFTTSALGLYFNQNMATKFGSYFREMETINDEFSNAIAKVTESGTELTIKLSETNKNALRTILEKVVEEIESEEKRKNSGIESILSDELLETIETEVEAGVEEIINSKEMKDLKNVLENL